MNAYSNQWVVSLAHYPEPDMSEVDPEIVGRADALLATWRKYVPQSTHEGFGDFEDFFEQAARLDAALSTFGEANCWLFLNSGPARNLASGVEAPKDALVAVGMHDYGILHSMSYYPSAWQRQNDLIDTYIFSPAFQRNAGRETAVCGFAPDDPADLDLRDALVDFASRHRQAIIKVARSKHGFFWVDLPEDLDREGADVLMWDAMDMAPLNYEGRGNSFLLQERIEMRYEYRFFVVNDEVVTGAGCVEEFTPLNNRSQFDDRVREVRLFDPSEVESRPDVLATYLPFAQAVAKEIAAENMLHSYSLDVALGSDGKPLVIELNGLPNSGLYASDPNYVVQALLRGRS